MGAIRSAVGHLCIDLSHVVMSGDEQQALLRTVQAAVVGHLAKVASNYKVITISLSPNNGHREREEDEPVPHDVPDTPEREAPPPEKEPPARPPQQ